MTLQHVFSRTHVIDTMAHEAMLDILLNVVQSNYLTKHFGTLLSVLTAEHNMLVLI